MLLAYGKHTLSFAASGSQSPVAAFLNDSAALADGRTGTSASLSTTGGVQSTAVYSEIIVSITSTLDSTIPWGFVCVSNVQGLPAGTKLTFNGVTQRLTYNRRGELGACWIPSGVTGASHSILIYNDVNSVDSLTPGQTFSIGEIFVGRLMYLRESSSSPTDGEINNTLATTSVDGQEYRVQRKRRRSSTLKIGPYSTTDAFGGSTSTLLSGAVSSGTIDLQTLRDILSDTGLYAICVTPSAGRGAGTVTNGIRFDKDFMQANWYLAHPTLPMAEIAHDMDPYWALTLGSQEAT